MNISKAAKQALIPIERKIKSEPVEHIYVLNKSGNILTKTIGSEHEVTVSVPDFFYQDKIKITHNHPKGSFKSHLSHLSPGDIRVGIKNNISEVRATTKDGFCHLVEIPDLKPSVKEKCYELLKFYEMGINLFGINMKSVRSNKKNLEKAGGLKFRTIPLPK